MKFTKKILSVLCVGVLILSGIGASSDALWKNYRPYGGFDGSWKRFYGRDRIKTSEYTANSLNPHKNATDVHPLPAGQSVPTVIVNQNSFQDGLSAQNICSAFNARLLLVRPDYANIGLMKGYYHSKTVYILGSEKEIFASTEKYIKRFMPGTNVVRIGHASAYERNLATLKMGGFKNLAVADGRSFPDALTASALCNNKKLGLMLVDGSRNYNIPAGSHVSYTIGGESSVAQNGGVRLSGQNRYETGKAVMREMAGYDNLLFVDGRKFPDSISAINLIKPRNAGLLLIADGRDNSDMKEFLIKLPAKADAGWDIEKSGYALIIGGMNSLADNTVIQMLYPR